MMIENDKLQQVWEFAKPGFDELDGLVASICCRTCAAATPNALADAFVDGVASAMEVFFEERCSALAAGTLELRAVVRAALTPEIHGRIMAYTERFPAAAELFEKCRQEVDECIDQLLHPVDFRRLGEAAPGEFWFRDLPAVNPSASAGSQTPSF